MYDINQLNKRLDNLERLKKEEPNNPYYNFENEIKELEIKIEVAEAYEQGRAYERVRVIAMVKNRLGCYDHKCEDCYFKNGNTCKFDDL